MTENTQEISRIRTQYQEHIRNTIKLIDLHSYLYTATGYEFHKQSYDHLVEYVHRLKTHIKQEEEREKGLAG